MLKLPQAKRAAKFYKLAAGTASITGTGAIDTGLEHIDHAVVSVVDAESTIPTHSASITSISGGTINVVVVTHDSSANAIATSAKTVQYIAIGR